MPEVVDYKKALPISTHYPPVPNSPAEHIYGLKQRRLAKTRRSIWLDAHEQCVQYGHTGIPTCNIYILDRRVAIICYNRQYLLAVRKHARKVGKEQGVRNIYSLL